jgi:prepilin signal peptidase PulO-like enzyme (type II secretory pathway)
MIIVFSLFWGSFWILIIERYFEYLGILKNKKTITYPSYQRLNQLFLKRALCGRSSCNICSAPIPWYLNIPVQSYLFLQGRSKCCDKKIPKYLFIYEICFLMIGVANYYFVSNLYTQFLLLFVFSIMILIGILDWRYMLIPDSLSYLLLWFGLIFNLLFDQAFLWQSLMGVIFSYLALKLLQSIYLYGLKKNALGDADPLLVAAIAAWIGINWVPYFLLGASVLGIALIISVRQRDEWSLKPFPFGPSLVVVGYGLIMYRLF